MANYKYSFGTHEHNLEIAEKAARESGIFSAVVGLSEMDTDSSFGQVYCITYLDSDGNEKSDRIIKITKTEIYNKSETRTVLNKYKESIKNEAEIMSRINSNYVMHIFSWGTIPDHDEKGNPVDLYYLIGEKLNSISIDGKHGKSIDTIVLDSNGFFNVHQLGRFILDITQAIYDYRKLRISDNETFAHRDIKLDNILYRDVTEADGTKHKTYTLIDFGVARSLRKDIIDDGTLVSSRDNRCPEIKYNITTDHVDIYALGSTIYRLLSKGNTMWLDAAGKGNEKFEPLYSIALKRQKKQSFNEYYYNTDLKSKSSLALLPDKKFFTKEYLRFAYDKEYDKLIDLLREMLDANYEKRIDILDIQKRVLNMLGSVSENDYGMYFGYKPYCKDKKTEKSKLCGHKGDTEIVETHYPDTQETIFGKSKKGGNDRISLHELNKPIGIILFFTFLIESIGAIFFAGWPIINPGNYLQAFSGNSSIIELLSESLEANITINLLVLISTVLLRLIVLSIIIVFASHTKKQNIVEKLTIIVGIAGAVSFVASIVCFIIESSFYIQMSTIGVSLRCALLCSPIVVSLGITEAIPSLFYSNRNLNSGDIKINNKWLWAIYLCLAASSFLLIPTEFLCGFISRILYQSEGFWQIVWHVAGFIMLGASALGLGFGFYDLANRLIWNSIDNIVITPETTETGGKFKCLTHVNIASDDIRTIKRFAKCKKLEKFSAKAVEEDSIDNTYSYNLSYSGTSTTDQSYNSSSTIVFSSPNLKSLSINGFSLTGALAGFEELEQLTELSLVNCGINEIDSISKLKHLETVDFSNNNISGLSSSWYWASLEIKSFSCSNNKIEDLSRVILTVLRTFKGNNNQFTDISFLDKNAETLKECDISDNPLSQESINAALKNCKALESLTIGNRFFINGLSIPLQSLDFLRDCTKLKRLSATWGTISDLSPLNCNSLVYLDLSNNRISDVSQLADAFDDTENPTLILHDNSIQNIQDIPEMVYDTLDLSSNRIIDFSPLKGVLGQELLISYPFGYLVSELPQNEIDKQFIKQLDCLIGFTRITINCVPPEMIAKIKEEMTFLGLSPERYLLKTLALTD